MRELVARLASADSQVVIDTEQEIIRRGLNLLELQLAKRLATASAEERLQIVSALPQLSGINARDWLLLLTKDADARVRLSAYRWLLTMADEVTLKQVRAAARQDENLKIRRLATEPSRNRIR